MHKRVRVAILVPLLIELDCASLILPSDSTAWEQLFGCNIEECMWFSQLRTKCVIDIFVAIYLEPEAPKPMHYKCPQTVLSLVP